MRFRTIILLTTLTLVSVVLAATIVSVMVVIDRAARHDVASNLERAQRVFHDLSEYRQTLLRAEARVVAEEPRLKAVVATEDITHDTVLGVAQELKLTLRCDVFVLTDPAGRLLVDIANPTASGDDLSHNRLVSEALANGESSAVWTDAGSVYQMQGRRLSFGETVVGVLALGYRFDDRTAETVERQTASGVVVALDGKVVAASPLEDGDGAAVISAAGAVPVDSAIPSEIRVAGATDLALVGSLPGYGGEHALRYVVVRSLDRALAPKRHLMVVLWGILLLAMAGASALSLRLSHRLSAPIDRLVQFTRRIAGGDLTTAEPGDGPVEVQVLGDAMNRMVKELVESRHQLAAKERLEKEMEIAMRIQTSILPRDLRVPGLEIAAVMLPASEVGGDYYDVIPVEGGCWLGIGDVAGHGLTAGLAMMMVQSVVSALAKRTPDAAPKDTLCLVNEVLYDNIRSRLTQDEHVTFSLIRYTTDGRFVFAGAHEEILVVRAKDRDIEIVETPGTWLGARPDIRGVTVESTLQLLPGDVVVLYTDGITEARNASDEVFGEHLYGAVKAVADQPVEAIRDHVLAELAKWMVVQDDDCTLVVIRYRGNVLPA